jgi:hypothetical protein
MKWFRHDAARRMHPKFRAAGFWGAVAVDAAWEFAKVFDRDNGDVTDFWRDPSGVAAWLQLPEAFTADLARGMAAAERAHLIDRCADDSALIHDWVEMQPEPARARMAKHRERHRNADAVTNVISHRERETDVIATGQDRTGQDKEKRPATASRKRAASSLPSEHWAWAVVDSYHAAKGTPPVNRGVEADSLAALERIDGHPAPLVAEVIAWVATDVVDPPRGTWAGWAAVVRSLASLRDRRTKGAPRKFEVILGQYRDAQKPRADPPTRFPSSPVTTARCSECGGLMLYPEEGCDRCKAAAAAEGARA